MVAKITFPKKLLSTLHYHENKCARGSATCIAAVNYLQEAEEMSFYHKRFFLELRNELNDRAHLKTLHISLNFAPSEKLNDRVLKKIAVSYMQQIGFGDQPFLVYKHIDAGHPHIHLVSTTIRDDGSRIHLPNLLATLSQARKEIEAVFGLMKAEGQKDAKKVFSRTNAEKIVYGETELKRSVSAIVNEVYHNYRFSSLDEFNAALRQFNVLADRGNERGKMFKNRGLVYRVLDEKGKKVGVPIKASTVNSKPTLENLEKKFPINQNFKEPLKQRVRDAIRLAVGSSDAIEPVMQQLRKQNIYMLAVQNGKTAIHGICFVDNETKAVFTGSDLGEPHCVLTQPKPPREVVTVDEHSRRIHQAFSSSKAEQPQMTTEAKSKTEAMAETLTSAQGSHQSYPFQLKKREKKRKTSTQARIV